MATIRDVAKLSGYSVATVSRVINKSGYVGKETEQRIIKAMEEVQFKPNMTARSLAGKNSSTIALMIPDILNPFFPEAARAVEDAAQELGYTVILCNTDNSLEKELNYFDVLINKKIDGMIIASYQLTNEHLNRVRSKGIPVVMIDNQMITSGVPVFVSKNKDGGILASKHLLEQGCKKIAHISGPYQLQASRDRALGFEEVCANQPWFLPSLIVQSEFNVQGGYQAMMQLLDRHPDLDGVFAGNDLIAAGALKALYERKLYVPDQIKLIGFDGIAMDMTVPPISTVAQPIYEIGKSAMQHLYKMIQGEPVEAAIYEFDTVLKVKESSKQH